MNGLQRMNQYAGGEMPATPTEIAAKQQYLEKFGSGTAYWASCFNGNPVRAVPLNTSGKGPEENPRIQFNYTGGDENEVVRYGGPGSQPGSSPFYGLAPSAADSNAVDQFGVGVRATVGFSAFVFHEPVVISQIQMFTNDATQIQQFPSYNEIWYDFTVNPTLININHSFSRQDDNNTTWSVFGSWFLTNKKWLEITLLADVQMTMVLTLAAANTVYDFRQVGCAPTSPNVVGFNGNGNGSPAY